VAPGDDFSVCGVVQLLRMQFGVWEENHVGDGSGSDRPSLEHQGIIGASGMYTTPTSATDSRTAGVNGNAAKRRDTVLEISSNRHYLWLDYRADNPAFLQPL